MKHKKHLRPAVIQPSKIQPSLQNVTVSQELFAGPLPHPDILRGYNEIVPGAAKMILDKFEAQTDHRRKLEGRVVTANIWQAFVGQLFAFVILLALIGSGSFLIYKGRDIGGLVSIVSAICGAIVVFIKGRSAKATDLQTKRGNQPK